VTTDPGVVTVEVEDDAGGFDLAAVPAGRALHRLRQDLGADRLTCIRTTQGSRVRVMVPSGGDNGLGAGYGGHGGHGAHGAHGAHGGQRGHRTDGGS
jgi:hypothetical protein